MRPDVKLGIVISMVFVLVAGTYFLYQDGQEAPLEVSSGPAVLAAGENAENPSLTSGPTTKRAAVPQKTGGQPNERRSSLRKPTQRPAQRTSQADASAKRRRQTPKSQPTVTRPGGNETAGLPSGGNRQVRNQPSTQQERQASLAQAMRPRNRSGTQRSNITAKRPKPQRALTATAHNDLGLARDQAAVERHRVQEGDTMSSLAIQYYGSPKYTAFLASRNPQIADSNQLRIGDMVNIPAAPLVETVASRSTPGRPPGAATSKREYRVKSGDSFYKIARDVLGDATRWRELYELNKHLVEGDPTRLKVDQVIALPTK